MKEVSYKLLTAMRNNVISMGSKETIRFCGLPDDNHFTSEDGGIKYELKFSSDVEGYTFYINSER